MVTDINTITEKKRKEAVPVAAPKDELKIVLQGFPQEIQNELIQMIRRDPRIAKCLTEAQGRKKEIIEAVNTGRKAGSVPIMPSLEEQRNLWKRSKGVVQRMFKKKTSGPKSSTPYINASDLPDVHPDFALIAQGAYQNAMAGIGIGHEHDHDEEHHEHHEEEHHESHDFRHRITHRSTQYTKAVLTGQQGNRSRFTIP